MTRTTLELPLPLKTSTPHQRQDVWPLRMIQRVTDPIHGGPPLESGFVLGTLRPQIRDLNTKSPRPRKKCKQQDEISYEKVNNVQTNF
ncbi:hypothetical protein AVEN_109039-1 [Araneus ventricosus]|uniref:Uncharacterized protein n=1 Tax=Araneus ventricosus TaxID=182803 RepID=A0A4Y2R7N4_ARAVE|nr:hypothetical protein AVEN_109039-1 [Araneus ventricosus]